MLIARSLLFRRRTGRPIFTFEFGYFLDNLQLPVHYLSCNGLSFFPRIFAETNYSACLKVSSRLLTTFRPQGLELSKHGLDAFELLLEIFDFLIDLSIFRAASFIMNLRYILGQCSSE